MLNFSNSTEELLNWEIAQEYELFIHVKRDDLIHPIVSGNKWRKLHLLFDYAIKNKYDEIVTFGGAYSNHLVATACAGNIFGIKTIGIVRGDEYKSLNLQLSLCKQYGMELHFVSREAYSNKKKLSSRFSKNNNLIIDEGGRHPLAIEGAKSIIDELKNEYDFIILPVGTGTTLEGIIKGIKERKLKTKIIAFSALKENKDDYERINPIENSIWWIDEKTFGGFGKYSKELVQFSNQFVKETRILIDPIYQAKMYYGLEQMIKQNYFNKNDKILCLQTGGNLGFYTNKMNKLIAQL